MSTLSRLHKSLYRIYQFPYVALTTILGQGILDTALNMILQDQQADFFRSAYYGRQLGQYIDTVFVLLHHLLNASEASFYVFELDQYIFPVFVIRSHDFITPFSENRFSGFDKLLDYLHQFLYGSIVPFVTHGIPDAALDMVF
ncbi:hypothetical protein HKBW3S09_00797 [Candidatus Hakubella thermalkaliphila]|uniref:Uncharacterized protein n=1 Tax=Candidatus Hakubella thermalkaliphila TaxID=2754717 RepID=A0A6V8NV71_9ACTN|nr:hypothetical protein HKBW3S09_00797 [Candidatus Hakubella thermalkaliphila]